MDVNPFGPIHEYVAPATVGVERVSDWPAQAGLVADAVGWVGLHDVQPGYVNDAIRVRQLKVPLETRYSSVYQKVQPSAGSTLMVL